MRVRMKRRTGSWLAGMAALALLATASTASAEYYGYSRGPKTELTLYGGGYFGGDIYTGVSSGLSRDVNVDDDWSYGARLAYIFNGMFGLEAGYGHSDAVLNLGAGGGQLLPEPIGDLAEDRYELNLNFYTNPGPVRGYFTLGGGATDFTATFDNDTEASETKFTSNIGLGIMFSKSPKFAFRVDGRWRYTDTNIGGDDVYCDFYGYCYSYDNSYYGSGEVTGGIVLGLGGD
jgi:hypothetical protein